MSRARSPVDIATRHEIRDELGATLFVEAGSGTGKTTALVSRVVSLVARGKRRLREIAAITFTEAAAAELRDRIRFELERAARGESDSPFTDHERARCLAALDELDAAALSTLHGFAQRVLTEHPLEAGLPPRFEVVDEIAASVAFDQRWSDFVETLSTDPEVESVLVDALVLGMTFDRLRATARALHDNYDRLRRSSLAAEAIPPVDLTPMLGPLDAAIDALCDCAVPDADRLSRYLGGLVPARDMLAAAVDPLDRLDLLAALPKLSCRYGDQRNWDRDVTSVRTLLEQAEDARCSLLRSIRRATLTTLLERVRGFVLASADERRREGRLEFHDLLVLAQEVLQRRPEVRETLARRFPVILIDEFQDTDPLQIEIAALLATADVDAGAKSWWETPIEAGHLFFVGDPKQSIYRFRRADLALYHRVQAQLEAHVRRLVQNFRCVPGIVAWVNAVFERLFDSAEPGVQAPHVQLEPSREALPGAPDPVRVFGRPVEGEPMTAIREREAADVAALVQRVKAEEWPILDHGTREVRPARFDDIALLLPTRTALPALEAALERADVPVRIESQSLVFSTPEVRDLLAILTALDDRTDEVALVAALRSPAFGCADGDLVGFHRAGGRWDYCALPPESLPPGHPVVAALGSLRELHEARWWQSVSQTVEAVIRERRLFELAVTHRRPRDHWRRLRFFLDRARAYEEAGGAGLRGFVDWVEQQADEGARAVEVVVPEPDDDALRILTVHGAKGLEFPIVILAGLNALPPTRARPVLWNADGGFEVALGSGDTRASTEGYDGLREREKLLEAAERLRLLYVAATRARDYLLVSVHHKANSDCLAARLWEHEARAPWVPIDLGDDRLDDTATPAPVEPELVLDEAGMRERWIADRTELLVRAGRPASVGATTLAKERHPELADAGLDKDDREDDTPAWRRGRAGTSVGRAVHAVLQSIDLDHGDGLDPAARAQALAEGVPSREGDIRALARSVLAAPVVRDAVAAGRFWREVPVAAQVEGVTVEGFVDLLVETPAGLVVVDYKTDQIHADTDLDDAMDRYRLQGATYALALEQVLHRPVARCVFVFARAGAAIERSVDDLPDAVAEVAQCVRGWHGPRAGSES